MHSPPLAEPVKQDTHYAWYVALVLSAVHATAILDRYLMGLVVEPMKAEMGFSDTEAGLLVGPAFLVLFCVFAIPIGVLADLVSRRWLIAAGLSVWTLATAGVAFAGSFETLFVARAFVGIGEACLLPAGLSLLAAYFSSRQIGRATGVFTLGGTLGKAAAFMAGGVLLAYLITLAAGGTTLLGRSPWRALFLLACLPGAILIVALLTVREPPRAARSTDKLRLLPQAVGYIGSHLRTYGGIIVVASMMNAMSLTLAAWAVSFFVRVHELQISEAGKMVGAIAIAGGALGALLGSTAIDVLRVRGLRTSAFFVLGAAQFLLAVFSFVFTLFMGSTWLTVAGYGFVQLSLAAALPAAFASIQDVTPDRVRGSVISLIMVGYTLLGGFIGPTLVGVLSDLFFVDAKGIATALNVAALIFGLIGAGAVWLSWGSYIRAYDANCAVEKAPAP